MALRWTIYCHTHIESGRRYIGLTKLTMMKRWNQHLANARTKSGKGCVHFWNALRMYGKESFSHEVLETCSNFEVANTAEISWIEFYDSTNYGFNISKGGDHAVLEPQSRLRISLGVRASLRIPSVIANRSAASKAMWQDPGFREKVTGAVTEVWRDSSYRSKM